MLQAEAGKAYDNYGAISRSILGAATQGTPEEIEAGHWARLEKRLDQVADVVTRMAEMIEGQTDDQASVNMEQDIQ